jgi:hypothetical protein
MRRADELDSLEDACTVGAGVASRRYSREVAQQYASRVLRRVLVDIDVFAESERPARGEREAA